MKFSFRSPAIDSVKIIIVAWVTMISAIIINVGISTHRDLKVSSCFFRYLLVCQYKHLVLCFVLTTDMVKIHNLDEQDEYQIYPLEQPAH